MATADRFDRFTDRARKVLTLAQDEAQRFNHNYIGTEHLLLGLVREGEGVAAKVLENLNVELAKVRTGPDGRRPAIQDDEIRRRLAVARCRRQSSPAAGDASAVGSQAQPPRLANFHPHQHAHR